jgi:hypothetical protein
MDFVGDESNITGFSINVPSATGVTTFNNYQIRVSAGYEEDVVAIEPCTAVNVLSAIGEVLRTYEPTVPQYIDLEGATRIQFVTRSELPVNSTVTYQVKVV